MYVVINDAISSIHRYINIIYLLVDMRVVYSVVCMIECACAASAAQYITFEQSHSGPKDQNANLIILIAKIQ